MLNQREYYQLLKQQPSFALLSQCGQKGCLLVSQDLLATTTLARLFAMQSICKQGGCGDCSDCRRIQRDIHPDVVCVIKDKIVVDDIDKICEHSLRATAESEKRIFVVADIAKATEQAQNKLLKTLEEPPRNACFVLCASTETGVLGTIQSRCTKIFHRQIALSQIRQVLQKEYGQNPNFEMALAFCGGSLQCAEQILNTPGEIDSILLAVWVLVRLKTSANILEVAKKILDNKANLLRVVEHMETILVSIFESQGFFDLENGQNYFDRLPFLMQLDLPNFGKSDIIELVEFYNASSIGRILPQIKHTKQRLQHNGNATMIVDEMLFEILEKRHLAKPH
ncbi:MAG: hypothetical protein FWD76_04640 [Firmicutes bacterium]|nr:hypothetical protein [Bacillota bacterium]